jgi:SPP1 family predicted phage head-tail adaptor
MIYSGTLTERLYFYHQVESQSASGFKQVDEVFYYTCRADRLKNKENYVVNADELFHFPHLTFKLRYNREILETDIVVYEDVRYRITSIDKDALSNEETIIIEKIND